MVMTTFRSRPCGRGGATGSSPLAAELTEHPDHCQPTCSGWVALHQHAIRAQYTGPPLLGRDSPEKNHTVRVYVYLEMEGFFKDLTHSLRMFRRSPGFTIAAVAALTLGIGTNTAIFTVVNAVLLKPVPFPDPNRLVMFMNTSPQGSGPAASPAKFAHWGAQPSVIQDVSAFGSGLVNL